jgi:chromosome segregation ATPase
MDEITNGGKDRKIISELITHINQLESKIASLEETISETSDLQTVNKLDIINLKNELEKIKLVFPSVSPEQIGKFQEISKMLESSSLREFREIEKKIEKTAKSVESLYKRMESAEPASLPEGLVQEIESLKAGVDSLQNSQKSLGPLLREGRRLVSQLKSEMGRLRSAKATKGGEVSCSCSPRKIRNLEASVANLKMEIRSLEKRAGGTKRGGKAIATHSEIRELEASLAGLRHDIKSVKERVSGLKPVKIPENVNEIDTIKKDLYRTESSLRHIRHASEKLSHEVSAIKKSLAGHSGKFSSLESSLSDIRKEIKMLRKESAEDIERGKKETVRFILKELRKMVS